MSDSPEKNVEIDDGLIDSDNLQAHKIEVIESIEGFAGEQISLLLPIDEIWQPQDFLPELTKEGWSEEIQSLRNEAAGLSDEVLIVLIGDMVTEEALPTYQTMLNRFGGVSDKTGVDESAWARWSRGWTAEENRHGDLLNRFLYLIGRVNMRSIEKTIQNLISNGFNPGIGQDPYKGFVYTSFQERATKISHKNVSKLAQSEGCSLLNKICDRISGDEARHEEAYKRFMDKIFEIDPKNALIAFRDMMKYTIKMPAHMLDDGEDSNLFKHFETVAQRLGVYTAHDYTEIIQHLVERWNIPSLTGIFGEAARAQDYLGNLGERYRKLADRFEKKMKIQSPVEFDWIFNRSV